MDFEGSLVGEGEVQPAEADRAYYHFQQFVLRLADCSEQDLFATDGGRLRLRGDPSHAYSLLAHELTHYAQALGTVVGQRILLNWFAVAITVAQELRGQSPLPVPVWKASGPPGPYRRVAEALNSYLKEVNYLVGASLDIRPAAEVSTRSAWEFYDYKFAHPVDGTTCTGIALVVPDPGGSLVGVPLQGDAFIEGQAQAVQWMTDGTSLAMADRFQARPVDPRGNLKKDIYYTAVARLVHATLPDWDCLPTTALLCDIALCARRPASAFHDAYRYLASKPPVPAEQYSALRAMFAQQAHEKEGRELVGAELAKRAEDFKNADGASAAGMMLVLNDLMVRAWVHRNADPAYFLDLHYGEKWLERVVVAIGAPPLFLADSDHVRTLTDDATITKACFWSRGSFDVLWALIARGFTDPCPFLRTRICDWHKEAVCREGDLLNAPVRDGRGCHVAFAAEGLELRGRPWRKG